MVEDIKYPQLQYIEELLMAIQMDINVFVLIVIGLNGQKLMNKVLVAVGNAGAW